MPYREEVAALEARVEALECEIASARAHLRAAAPRGRAADTPVRRSGALLVFFLVAATGGAAWVVLWAMARPTEHAFHVPEAVTWPPSPPACLNALPVANATDDASLAAQFDQLHRVKADLARLDRDPPPPRTSELWGSPTLTISAAPRATTASAIDLGASWSNTTSRTVAILDKPEHRRSDAAYALFVRDEKSGRSYRLRDSDTSDFCGTPNTYHAKDVLHLPPGARSDTDARTPADAPLRNLVIRTPGVYTLWLTYQFCGYGGERGGVSYDVDEPDLYVGVAVSNGVRVEVTAPP